MLFSVPVLGGSPQTPQNFPGPNLGAPRSSGLVLPFLKHCAPWPGQHPHCRSGALPGPTPGMLRKQLRVAAASTERMECHAGPHFSFPI